MGIRHASRSRLAAFLKDNRNDRLIRENQRLADKLGEVEYQRDAYADEAEDTIETQRDMIRTLKAELADRDELVSLLRGDLEIANTALRAAERDRDRSIQAMTELAEALACAERVAGIDAMAYLRAEQQHPSNGEAS